MLPITTTLAQRELGLMLDRAQRINTALRQKDASDRLLILQGNWLEVGQGRVIRNFTTPEIRRWISNKVNTIFNLLATVTDRVCVSYKVPPTRTLKDAPQGAQDAWQLLLSQSRIATIAKTIEKYTFGLNVIYVVPQILPDPRHGKRLSFQLVLPHCCERKGSAYDPTQTESISYSVKDTSDRTGGRNPIVRCLLDADAYYYLDDKDRIVDEWHHGAGVFPGVAFRLAEAPPDDFWDSHRGSAVVDATLECAVLAARLSWIRSFQDHKREILFSKRLQQIPLQVAGAQGPVQVPLDPGGDEGGNYQVHDLITSIDEHVKHIKLLTAVATESIGVPSTLVDFESSATNYGNVTGLAAAQQHEALASVRSNHIEYLREAEADLWWRAALVMRGAGHPLASTLTPDLIADSFQITFPQLTFVDHPKARADVWRSMIDLGLLSTYQAYREAHPELTPDEARAAVDEIAEQEASLNELYVERNLPRDLEERRNTIAQLQGRRGGQQKALNAADEGPAGDGEAD